MSAVMPTYARADVVFERGEGAYLFDTAGRRYLDFVSGVAVTALGHAPPRLIAALTAQAQRVWHTSNLFRVAGQETLAQMLCAHTFAETVFFTNSGTEAWECGLKIIRKHFHDKGQPQRNRVITCEFGFHGRTMAAISAVRQERMVTGFAPLLEGFDVVPFADLAAMEAAIGPETAAICVEPIQGEGGVQEAPTAYLQGLRALADRHGLLLFLDEIQTGVGRTGTLFAHEAAGVVPDVMCIAKGIGGGFPVGACLATAAAASGMTAGTHGSTYGGNPLAMAVAQEVLTAVLEPGFLAHVQAMGAALTRRLDGLVQRFPSVFTQVRGRGLLQGLRCGPSVAAVVAEARQHQLLVPAAANNVLRLLPPLTVTETELAEAEAALAATAEVLVAAPPAA